LCYVDFKEGGVNKISEECRLNNAIDEHLEMFWVIMNTAILISSGLYCMFYARIFEQFGRMIKLIGSVLWELSIFMTFFSFWILMFCFLTRIAGQDVDPEEYNNLGINTRFFINVFRNSMGDVQPPDTSLWNNHLNKTISTNRISLNS
jgi:hypothetical protein